MKQRLIKVLSVSMVACCAVSFTAFGKDSKIDESTQTMLEQTAEGLSDAIVSLSDEDIENYKNSQDAFTAGAMEAWEGSRDDLGELVELGEAEIEYSGGTYTVTVPGDFSEADAEFIYLFKNPTGAPESLTINVKLPMSTNLKNAGLNTLMGLGIVFLMLIFLSFVIKLMGTIVYNAQNKTKPAEEKSAPVSVPAAAPVAEEEYVDDTELIAVIAAAVAAAEGTTPDGFVVRSVRKVNRRKW